MSDSTFDIYLTTTGRSILNKLLAGEKLTITKAVLSSQTPTTPEELTDISPEILQSSQIALTDHGTYTQMELAFNLNLLETDLDFNSIGVYGYSSNSTESLIYVILVSEEQQLLIPAGSPITYVVSVKETLTQGKLQVNTSPSYATPISHNSDFTRHLFSQTNDSTTLALVNSGVEEVFVDNDTIIFVPKVNMASGSTLRIASNDYTLAFQDIEGNTINGTFIAHKPYGLAFDSNNTAFVYKSYDKIEIVSGIPHYWNGVKWCSTMQAGLINAFDLSSAPAGYLLCNGASVSKTTYTELFTAIGYRHGGSGDNFNLPNLQGRMLLGVNGSHSLGSTGGSETRQLDIANMPAHTHDVSTTSKDNNTTYALKDTEDDKKLFPYPIGYPRHFYSLTATDNQNNISITENSKGSGQAFNIMNPYLSVNYFISTGKSLI